MVNSRSSSTTDVSAMRVRLPDVSRPLRLVGIYEIAQMLGVTRQRAHALADRDDFPRPALRLHMGRVWRTAEVERWIAKQRPPKS